GRERFLALQDGFDRVSTDDLVTGLGYAVSDSSPAQTGIVAITASPLNASDSVLQLTSVTGDPIAISTDADFGEFTEISFDYLFQDPGKIDIYLGGTKLGTLTSPISGAGSPGSESLAHYLQHF